MSKKQAALKRWNILADVIKSKNCVTTEHSGSKRMFHSYNLVKVEPLDEDTEAAGAEAEAVWKVVSYREVSTRVRYLAPRLDLGQLTGFNNTGNVCVWPSEESLAVFCLNNLHLFKEKSVLEVGGGMTALAGCLLAATAAARTVHLTDGNATSVNNLQTIVQRAASTPNTQTQCDSLHAFRLRWDEDVAELADSYDAILSADCLFFTESAASLVAALHTLLRPRGAAYIAAPNREGTFGHFKRLAEEQFGRVEELEDYSVEVTKAHESWLGQPGYTPDIHYPKMLVLTK